MQTSLKISQKGLEIKNGKLVISQNPLTQSTIIHPPVKSEKRKETKETWIELQNGEVFSSKIRDPIVQMSVEENNSPNFPIYYFQLFFTDELFKTICEFSNKKAAQEKEEGKNHKRHSQTWKDISFNEIKAFFGIVLHMGITNSTDYKSYWSTDPSFKMPGISRVMHRDRFIGIKKYIYFAQLDDQSAGSKSLQKFDPVFQEVLSNCARHWTGSSRLIVDESMVAYTGNHGGKVKMPSKPIDTGFKFYVLADNRGYALNFFPSFILDEDDRHVMKIVHRLTEPYDGQGYYLYMDR